MTATDPGDSHAPRLQGKLIQCVVTDDGTDKVLLKALRDRMGIVCGHSSSCRSIAMFGPIKAERGKLPPSQIAKLVQIIVSEDEAEAVFELVFETGGFDRPGRGVVLQGPVAGFTPFALPADVLDERE